MIEREPPGGHRPAEAVAGRDQSHPDRRAHRPGERAEGVGGDAAEQRPGLRRLPAAREQGRRRRGRDAEARQADRVLGQVEDRAQQVLVERVEVRRGRPKSRRQAAPSSPSPARSRRSSAPSPRRCRRRADGRGRPRASATRGRGPRGRASCRNGEAAAIGWTAEQSSWRTPGTVSSLVRVPPPIVSAASSTVTSHPLARQRHRAGQPVGAGADDDRVAQMAFATRFSSPGFLTPGPPVTSTGKSNDSSSHGWRSTMSATATDPSSTRPLAAS